MLGNVFKHIHLVWKYLVSEMMKYSIYTIFVIQHSDSLTLIYPLADFACDYIINPEIQYIQIVLNNWSVSIAIQTVYNQFFLE